MLKVTGGRDIDKKEVRRILIRATNWVGDSVMTLPALEAVRDNFPESSLTVLAKPWVVPMFEDHPAVDRVITYRKETHGPGGLGEMIRTVRLIRRSRFDLAILFQNAFEAALLARLGGVKLRVGYDTDGRGFLLTHRIHRSREVLEVHQVEYYLSILRALGWDAAGREPSLHLARDHVRRARALMEANGIGTRDFLVGLSPGAMYGEAKRWPRERFALIGDRAAERWNARVLVFGSEKEAGICDAVTGAMGNRALNLCGRTSLGEALGLIDLCDLFVTNDSGLMHVAAALGVPTVAVFGSTDPVATGPRGPRTMIVKHEVDCAPCLRPECPTDYRCMLSIDPEEVWKAMEIMKEGGPGKKE